MPKNSGQPECYVDEYCTLICKDADGVYELPGRQLSRTECDNYLDYLQEGIGGYTGGLEIDGSGFGDKKSDGRGFGDGQKGLFNVPNWLKPFFDFFRNILKALGIDLDLEDVKKLAKLLLIIGVIVIVLVLIKK